MRKISIYFMAGIVVCSLAMSVGCRGYRGKSYVREADGSIGSPIAGVKITFIKEDESLTRSVVTDSTGSYRIPLNEGRYWVTGVHPDYEDYSSVPGFFVVRGIGYKTGNIFLRTPRVTTVLLVRHAERSNDSLSQAGLTRSEKLAHVVRKAGVTKIYTTDFNRTKQTAQPLADFLKVEPVIYNAINLLVDQILLEHKGDVVLVVGHSNTLPDIIEQFLGENISTQIIEEFDNLFVITQRNGDGNTNVNVINLQYGEISDVSPPPVVGSFSPMTTILLVRNAELDKDSIDTDVPDLSQEGQRRAEKLVHVALKAGVSAIYTTITHQKTVWPLSEALGLEYSFYEENNIGLVVNEILQNHAGNVVFVVGDNISVSGFIRVFGGSPFPPIFQDEYDSLFVLTARTADDAKVVSLQYGEPSR